MGSNTQGASGSTSMGPQAGARAGTGAVGTLAPDGWPTGSPSQFGLDPAVFETIAENLQAASGNTRLGVVVVKEGTLIYEKYWDAAGPDAKHPVYSCTKSWGSTLVGIAVHQGLLTVDDEVTKWVPQPAPEVGKGALIKHILTQTAQTTPPGMEFAYNSGSIVNTLPEILESASGMSSHSFFARYLATPLQLSLVWPACGATSCSGTRYKPDYIQFGDGGPNPVMTSTIRDQAKLGWLWLNDGMWNGERLIDTAYIQAATQPSFPSFQSIYGYLWWLNRMGPGVGPLGATLRYNPDVPDDMYHAIGGIGQCSIAVLPSQRMVIAHVGNLDSNGLGGHWELFAPLFRP